MNGKKYDKGTYISPFKIYPFFLIHMLMFGGSGFFMAYFTEELPLLFLYIHGGFAVFVYLIFYLTIFGIDEIKWLAINSLLGVFGIYAEIGLLLSAFGKDITDYPAYIHVIPFLYYVLYTFLIRRMILDISGAGEDEERRTMVNKYYVIISVVVYLALFFIKILN